MTLFIHEVFNDAQHMLSFCKLSEGEELHGDSKITERFAGKDSRIQITFMRIGVGRAISYYVYVVGP